MGCGLEGEGEGEDGRAESSRVDVCVVPKYKALIAIPSSRGLSAFWLRALSQESQIVLILLVFFPQERSGDGGYRSPLSTSSSSSFSLTLTSSEPGIPPRPCSSEQE